MSTITGLLIIAAVLVLASRVDAWGRKSEAARELYREAQE